MLPPKETKKIGECETCPKQDVEINLRYGNMWMCDDCWIKEQQVSAERMKPENQQKRVNEYLEYSRKQDERVQTKQDLFNADTVAAVELQAAINADDSIPPDQKRFAYAKVCMERFQQFTQLVFDDRVTLNKHESAMRMWQIQVRTVAADLSNELREKFKTLDPGINYNPVPPKTIKPSASKVGKKFDKDAINAAAAKYGIPAAAVQMLVVAKGLSPEDAAKLLSGAGGGKS